MQLTPEQIIEVTLKPGAVYKYTDPTALKNNIPHYFILLNKDPKNAAILIFVCISSKVTKTKARAKKRKQAANTLVELQASNYEFLTMDSIVDCNNIAIRDKDWIINKYKNDVFGIEKEIDKVKQKALQDAFLKSKNHDKAIKRIIDPNI